VVRQPHILLLDEATSALDEDSQKKVQAALFNVMQSRTSIVIAHRLTTIEKCNRVAVLEDGVIVEEGSFEELQTRENGYFQTLASGASNQL
jgi:ABC-type multidrug transport system fused ATPase/permease subunit